MCCTQKTCASHLQPLLFSIEVEIKMRKLDRRMINTELQNKSSGTMVQCIRQVDTDEQDWVFKIIRGSVNLYVYTLCTLNFVKIICFFNSLLFTNVGSTLSLTISRQSLVNFHYCIQNGVMYQHLSLTQEKPVC